MEHIDEISRHTDRAKTQLHPTHWPRIFFVALLIGFAALALVLHRPPAPRPLSAPVNEFSAARAMVHLQQIAKIPHPTGSDEHRRVREYILANLRAYGLSPEVQRAERSVSHWKRPIPGGLIYNIIVILPGKNPGGPAALLSCHYDSVAMGPGAGDDGAAVSAMLETIRALRNEKPLENDIIFLFTDGEELGLVGAEAFTELHPLASRAAVVLNFEARGSGGPVHMFETSAQNGWLIKQLAQSGAPIKSASLASAVYKRMPNDTDLTVFLRNGKSGLGFAFIDGLRNYHTPNDDIAHLDPGSMEHHGELMLALSRRLGNADLSNTKDTDAIYFNILGNLFVHYPGPWAYAFLFAAALACGAAAFLGFKKQLLSLAGLLRGLALFIMQILASFFIGLLGWLLIRATDKRFAPESAERASDDGYYAVALLLIAGGAVAALASLASKKSSISEVFAGNLIGFFLFSAATAFGLQGGSFLFVWPLFAGSLGLIFWLWKSRTALVSYRDAALIALAITPLILLYTPIVHDLFLALTLFGFAAVELFFGMLLSMPAAFIWGAPTPRDRLRNWLPAALFTLGALTWLIRLISVA